MKVEITKLSHEGRGIAQIDGKAIFLEGGLPGEIVEFNYAHQKKRFCEGYVTQVSKPSIHRVVPQCVYSAACGGCSLQHIAPEFQVEHKQDVLLEHLAHIGQVKPLALLPPVTGPLWGYRRKARLGVRYVHKKQKVLVGFREKDGRYLMDMDHCAILDPRVGLKLQALKHLIMSFSCYRDIPQIEVAAGDDQVALVFRHMVPLSADERQKLLDFGRDHHFQIYLQGNAGTVDLIYPTENEATLSYRLPDYNLELFFQPLDFIQVNKAVNQAMVKQAISLLSPLPNETILDLFCGLGNFSLPLARQGAEVHAVEGSEEMVRQGQLNARNHDIQNVHFYSANLEDDLSRQPWCSSVYEKILLDPPRTGALNVVKQMAYFNPKKILYVSCNSATLARDAYELSLQGYVLSQAGVINMFPHTKHVECMALFEKSVGAGA